MMICAVMKALKRFSWENESGDGEIILMPKPIRPLNLTDLAESMQYPSPRGSFEWWWYCRIFPQLSVYSICEETIIKRSPRGQKVLVVLKKGDPKYLADIAVTLLSRVYSCIAAGKTYRLPSYSTSLCMHVWRLFHEMRNSEGIRALWKNFIALHTFSAVESLAWPFNSC